MTLRLISVLLACGGISVSMAADAAELAPHRAVYDVSLAGEPADIDSVEGRIVVEMTRPDCETFELDYRFVARFISPQDVVVTDQQTKASETRSGDRFTFDMKTYVDGTESQRSVGTATSSGQTTMVAYEAPTEEIVDIPLAAFPVAHTRRLIEAAEDGAFVHEAAIFDGDPDARKLTRSTAIISAAPAKDSETAAGDEDEAAKFAHRLDGLDRWRVSEAYYSGAERSDAEPDFRTAYTLYANGVSDDLTLSFEGYSLQGRLNELTYLDAPACEAGEIEKG
ncbi:MAG: DUF1849 family protein [Fulvimarina manganoxydans]|uniref:EipB family protein n=1 Tax=Fulvimarina manganoxydans TaxID=937218 RepID=UPI002352AAB5|nr:DUF1849 family protein [Fulvimarina manganoxydans]MCK5933220.1 DUF1849 family protein [Fulvimarina manganoxydans]